MLAPARSVVPSELAVAVAGAQSGIDAKGETWCVGLSRDQGDGAPLARSRLARLRVAVSLPAADTISDLSW